MWTLDSSWRVFLVPHLFLLKLRSLFPLSFPALESGTVSAGRSHRKGFRGCEWHNTSHWEATGVPSTGLVGVPARGTAGGDWVDRNIPLGNRHPPGVDSPGSLSRSCFPESAKEGEQRWTRELKTPSLPLRCPPSRCPVFHHAQQASFSRHRRRQSLVKSTLWGRLLGQRLAFENKILIKFLIKGFLN